MNDPSKKVNKLQLLSYIDDFIQNNVKVLENPRFTDIAGYHRLMKKIKSKMVNGDEDLEMRKQDPTEDPLAIPVKNPLSEVSCIRSDSTPNHTGLSSNSAEFVNCSTSKPITIKQELPEIKTEPNEHELENCYPEYLEIESDPSHNEFYELHNNIELNPVTKNTMLHKATVESENGQIKREAPFVKEEILTPDYELDEDNDDSIVKDEPMVQFNVKTDPVEIENSSVNNTGESIPNKKRKRKSKNNSKKKQVSKLKNKQSHREKHSAKTKPNNKNGKVRKRRKNKPRKPRGLRRKEQRERIKKEKLQDELLNNCKQEEITIKNCSVPLVKLEDELLNNYQSNSDFLLVRDISDGPMFNKLSLQDMMQISAGKQLTFFSPENVNILIDKLNENNFSGEEIILLLNTNDVVTRMYMDHFPQLRTAILENKVKVIDKTVAEIYTNIQA